MKKQSTVCSAFFTLRGLVTLVVCVAACSLAAGTLFGFFHAETPAKASARTLTFAERVACQRAVEDVYWRHRIWPKERPDPKPALGAVISEAQLEKKSQITSANRRRSRIAGDGQLRLSSYKPKWDRMAKHTKQPDVLRELFEALGNDPFVIADRLARAALAERLLTNSYAHDQQIRGELKQRIPADLLAHPNVEQYETTQRKLQRN